jgi:hypothetical protein
MSAADQPLHVLPPRCSAASFHGIDGSFDIGPSDFTRPGLLIAYAVADHEPILLADDIEPCDDALHRMTC